MLLAHPGCGEHSLGYSLAWLAVSSTAKKMTKEIGRPNVTRPLSVCSFTSDNVIEAHAKRPDRGCQVVTLGVAVQQWPAEWARRRRVDRKLLIIRECLHCCVHLGDLIHLERYNGLAAYREVEPWNSGPGTIGDAKYSRRAFCPAHRMSFHLRKLREAKLRIMTIALIAGSLYRCSN